MESETGVEDTVALSAKPKDWTPKLSVIIGLAICLPIVHADLYPFAPYLHPDTTGLVVSGEAIADEGRNVQPFQWDYIFEVGGKATISENQPVVDLADDERRSGFFYPPGYSLIIAGGRVLGLNSSTTCQLAFYSTLALSAFCWLLWSQRSGVPIWYMLVGLLTYLFYGPATITDPFGWLAAAVVLLIVTFEFRWSLIVLAAGVMMLADLVRHAAILVMITWFGLWMTRRIPLRHRFWICVSCAVVVVFDMSSKYLRTGGLDPLPTFSGGWPSAIEVIRGAYYALLGGWSPVSGILKVMLAGLAMTGFIGLALRPLASLRHRWVCDLLIVQAATAFVLGVAQYKYGADFTKAPIAIARYWHYCTPGLICLHLFGLRCLVEGRWDDLPFKPAMITQVAYVLVMLVVTLHWVDDTRNKWSGYEAGADGFARRNYVAEVHTILQSQQDLLAVLTDNHQLVFSAIDPRRTKCLYYMSGFYSDVGGRVAVATSASKRGDILVKVCDANLTLVTSTLVTERVSVRVYDLPPQQVIEFGEDVSVDSLESSDEFDSKQVTND